MENVNAIELVLFKFKAGTSEEKAIAAARSVNDFVLSQKGFISRKFAKTDDGRFVDLVYWRDMESAQNASKAAMEVPSNQAFFSLIEEREMVFLHATPVFELTK